MDSRRKHIKFDEWEQHREGILSILQGGGTYAYVLDWLAATQHFHANLRKLKYYLCRIRYKANLSYEEWEEIAPFFDDPDVVSAQHPRYQDIRKSREQFEQHQRLKRNGLQTQENIRGYLPPAPSETSSVSGYSFDAMSRGTTTPATSFGPSDRSSTRNSCSSGIGGSGTGRQGKPLSRPTATFCSTAAYQPQLVNPELPTRDVHQCNSGSESRNPFLKTTSMAPKNLLNSIPEHTDDHSQSGSDETVYTYGLPMQDSVLERYRNPGMIQSPLSRTPVNLASQPQPLSSTSRNGGYSFQLRRQLTGLPKSQVYRTENYNPHDYQAYLTRQEPLAEPLTSAAPMDHGTDLWLGKGSDSATTAGTASTNLARENEQLDCSRHGQLASISSSTPDSDISMLSDKLEKASLQQKPSLNTSRNTFTSLPVLTSEPSVPIQVNSTSNNPFRPPQDRTTLENRELLHGNQLNDDWEKRNPFLSPNTRILQSQSTDFTGGVSQNFQCDRIPTPPLRPAGPFLLSRGQQSTPSAENNLSGVRSRATPSAAYPENVKSRPVSVADESRSTYNPFRQSAHRPMQTVQVPSPQVRSTQPVESQQLSSPQQQPNQTSFGSYNPFFNAPWYGKFA